VKLSFTFAPTSAGAVSAAWSLSGVSGGVTFSPANGGTLTGTGLAISGGLTLTSAGHNFGSIAVVTASPVYGLVMTNFTTSSVSVTYGSVTSPFVLFADNCPATLAAGATCDLQFEYRPATYGMTQQVYSLSGKIGSTPVTITSEGTTVTGVTLTGTGD
jgi:hypothetical protein